MFNLFITAGLLLSQNLFANAYGGTDDDYAYSITGTSDGGLAVTGITYSFSMGLYDLLVLRLDSDGVEQWARSFGGTDWDEARCIITTSDGGFALAGRTRSYGAGNYDFLVLKLASDGTLQWARTFGGADWDEAQCIVQTLDGGFAVAGYTRSYGAGNYDFLVLKLASNGTLQWAKTFGGANYDYAYSITETPGDGLAVAGCTSSFGTGGDEVLVVNMSSDGTLDWARVIGGQGLDDARCIITTSDGGFALAGRTTFGAGNWDFLILKLRQDGSVDWSKTFGGVDEESAYSLTEVGQGDLVIAGTTMSLGTEGYDLLVLKLISGGTLEWSRAFKGADWDEAHSITEMSGGDLGIAGYTRSFGAGNNDFFVLKMGSDGEYPGCVDTCTLQESTPVLSQSFPSVGIDCSPVSMDCLPSGGNVPVVTTEVCSSVDAEETLFIPFNGIRYSPAPGGALFLADQATDMRIYSVDGRLVRSLRLQQGQNRITLDKGVYLWQAGSYSGKAVVR